MGIFTCHLQTLRGVINENVYNLHVSKLVLATWGKLLCLRRLRAFSKTQLFFHFSAFVLLLYASGYTRLKQLPSEATHISELGKTSILRLEI